MFWDISALKDFAKIHRKTPVSKSRSSSSLGSPISFWILPISYDIGSCADGLQKNSKSIETKIFAHSCQNRQIFFLNLELE